MIRYFSHLTRNDIQEQASNRRDTIIKFELIKHGERYYRFNRKKIVLPISEWKKKKKKEIFQQTNFLLCDTLIGFH